MICWGDSVRAYGFGVLLILLTAALLWRLADAPTPRRTALAAVFAVASVQSHYYNSVLLLGLGLGAAAVTLRRGSWRRTGLVLGVCNGFQIQCEAGLLPGVLMRNKDLRFICRMQHLRVERNDTPFTRAYDKGAVIKVAIAHGEGNYEADEETINRLEGEGRVAVRYCDGHGLVGGLSNPNGSTNDIAGIYSDKLNVLGMMPHPENLIDPLVGGIDGRGLFESIAAFAKAA
jgi:phosphoribosylformylglycinamidine synthase